LEREQSLVSSLLINDREEVYDDQEPVTEPRKAIEELVQMGESAVPILAALVERYVSEKVGRYYIEYVMEILGRVGGEQAVELVLRALLACSLDDFDDYAPSTCIKSLRTLKKTATPAIIKFVQENYGTQYAVMAIAEAIEEIRDQRLIPLLLKLLKYPDPVVVQSALVSLQNQDDKSIVPHIIPLLKYEHENLAEQREVRERALSALEGLLREDQSRLRSILIEHHILSPESLRELSKEVSSEIDALAWAYERGLVFKGDEGEQLTALLKERRAKKTIRTVLEKLTRLAYHETIIPYDEYQSILQRCNSLEDSENNIKRNIAEAFWLSDPEADLLGVNVAKTEERQVKGCHPMPRHAKERVCSILQSKGFAVSEHYDSILARSGRRSIVITSQAVEGKRVWANIRIRLCREWEEHEMAPILKELWEVIESRPMMKK